MIQAKLLKFFTFSLCALLLTACETCPQALQYADIGIRISPMACVSKAPKKEVTPVENTSSAKESAA